MQKGLQVLLLKKKIRCNKSGLSADLNGRKPETSYSVKNQVYQILSIIVTLACFIPLVVVLVKKLRSLPFILFALYWVLSGLVNLTDRIPNVSTKTLEIITITYNTLDIPIVLAIIHFTTSSALLRKLTGFASPGFLLLQVVNFLVQGFNYDAAKYALALGLVQALIALGWEVSIYMQKLEHTGKEKALVFIHASLLFAYGTFIIIYIFDYIVRIGTRVDNFLIYYISSLIAILIALVGFTSKGARLSQ